MAKRNNQRQKRKTPLPADQLGRPPRPGFEQDPPAEVTNRSDPEAPGTQQTAAGAGVVREGASVMDNPEFPDDEQRPPQSAPGAARPATTDSGVHATPVQRGGGIGSSGGRATETVTGGGPAHSPLSVPTGDTGEPRPRSSGIAAMNDPNFTAATRHTGNEDRAGSAMYSTQVDSSQYGRPRRREGEPPRTVQDVMTPNVECCTPDTNLQYVARMMMDRDCGLIPVVENMESMKLVGVVTDRDIAIRVVAKGQDPYGIGAAAAMSSGDLLCVRPDTPVQECVNQMEQRQVRRVPVVDEEMRVVGIVAQADIALNADEHETAELVHEVSEPPREHGQA